MTEPVHAPMHAPDAENAGHGPNIGQPGALGQPQGVGHGSNPGQPQSLGYSQDPHGPGRKNWFARHKVLTGVLAAGAFIVIIIAAAGGGDDPSSSPSSTANPVPSTTDAAAGGPSSDVAASSGDAAVSDEPTSAASAEAPPAEPVVLPGIGAAVVDGDFTFTVVSVQPGLTSVGDEYLNEQAQGQFVVIHVLVANDGSSAAHFSDSDQRLVDGQGREHSADSGAAFYAATGDGSGEAAMYTEINPGNTLEAVLVFDVPADAVPSVLKLRQSILTSGVEVSIAQ